jgi:hypothetical protein
VPRVPLTKERVRFAAVVRVLAVKFGSVMGTFGVVPWVRGSCPEKGYGLSGCGVASQGPTHPFGERRNCSPAPVVTYAAAGATAASMAA